MYNSGTHISSLTSSKAGLFQARCEYSCLSSLVAAVRKFRGKDVFCEERRFYSQVIDYFIYAQIPGFVGYSYHTQLFFRH